jgi:putative addiction module component (TIGR02574 family)
MPMTVKELQPHLMKLAPRERVELAYELLNSVDPLEVDRYDAAMEAEWEAEIKRRIEEIEAGTVETYDGEDVMAAMHVLYPDENMDALEAIRTAAGLELAEAEEIKRRLDEFDAGLAPSDSEDEAAFGRAEFLIKEFGRMREKRAEREEAP